MESTKRIRKDLTGMQFGRLTVLYRTGRKAKDGSYYYCCECECGKIKDVLRGALTSGNTKSCGCSGRGRATICSRVDPPLYNHPLYRVLANMKSRCYNSNNERYPNYGERGITICDEWLSRPGIFVDWGEANGYKKGLQIDRSDNDGNYSPTNCRFVTCRENNLNRRNTVYVLFNGEKTLAIDAAGILGVDYSTVYGWVRDKRVGKKYSDVVTLIEPTS